MTTPTPVHPLVAWVLYVAKALAALLVCVGAYMVGVLSGDQTLADLTTAQWFGLVVFAGAAYGITYAAPRGSRP